MTRESDEECLALIASIRDRARAGSTAGIAMRSEVERLLGNLEARIVESELAAHRLQLANESILHLTGEKGDLTAERDGLRSQNLRLRGKVEEAPKDCPCGTETCREAWRELRQAKADEQALLVKAWEERAESGVAIRFRDVIREEVAVELQRQLEVAFARLYAFVAGPDSLKSSDA